MPKKGRNEAVLMKRSLIALLFAFPLNLFAATAGVSVDYGSDINYFSPGAAFSINSGIWDGAGIVQGNAWQFQRAGIRYIRFPGGSHSNNYHWNGSGYYDTDNIWHVNGSPSPSGFAAGFEVKPVFRGTTSLIYGRKGNVTDTDMNTSWKSFAGETGPQWIYLNIQTSSYQPVVCDRVVIEWGADYAAQYKVQYSNANWPGSYDAWIYNDTAWKDTSPGTLSGTGGHDDRSFSVVSAKFIRILCLAPSPGTQYEIKDIKVYNGAAQVSVNSDDPVTQTGTVTSSMSYGDRPDWTPGYDFERFMTVCRSLTPAAEPLITINFFTGTTQEAADWVYYANVDKGYAIKYWEIGNENWGNWESGGPAGPEFYSRRFVDFYDAMKAVDPSITVLPQFCSADDPCNVTCNASGNPSGSDHYIESFLKGLQSMGRSDIITGISIHRYAAYNPPSEASVLASTNTWDLELSGAGKLNDWINTYCGGPEKTKIWLTEYNDGIDSRYTNNYYNSLFIPLFMLGFIKNGGDYGFLFTDFGNPGMGQAPGLYSDLGAIENGTLTGQYSQFKNQPRSSYWGLWMLNNRFAAADSLGNTLVSSSSTLPSFRVYADKRGDRKLSVMLVNTDPVNSVDANLAITGFTPLASADVMSFSPQQYSWVSTQLTSHADPDLAPVDSQISNAAPAFSVNVPAYNIKIITMYDASRETLTPSVTPTQPPTPTISPTPDVNAGTMLDNCEDGNLTDLWNGTWSAYGDGVSFYMAPGMTCDGAGAAGTNCYFKITGTVAAGNWGFGVNCTLSPSWSPVDLSGYDAIDFYFKGDAASQKRIILSASSTGSDSAHYGYDFTANTGWTRYTIPFSSLTQPSWLTTPVAWTGTDILGVQFQTQNNGGYEEMCADEISFRVFTKTPTAVITATSTPAVIGPTATITPTQAASALIPGAGKPPHIYPNPSKGLVNVFLPDDRGADKVIVTLYSGSFRLIRRSEHGANPENIYSMETKGLASGSYVLRVVLTRKGSTIYSSTQPVIVIK